ncbi:hypothetical protein BU24DRAFT_128054 [Aaosphaeria arxii CBS 175.79]|uniref:Uncharacterized protein n=1 Tax=Aaosphaeria arxii CBS 175.79 TaxID=1450172 RepID=A0A6A5Y4Y3_9PLEO|nr:uncharacterized protein BU24DRAFT_128054 [Aaosphaeria arxii CBS 175.79]KAF2019850.1 hypothetical protein BU24DRAFT_128054 [Aaosphaeria arxii CBS 175.79]
MEMVGPIGDGAWIVYPTSSVLQAMAGGTFRYIDVPTIAIVMIMRITIGTVRGKLGTLVSHIITINGCEKGARHKSDRVDDMLPSNQYREIQIRRHPTCFFFHCSWGEDDAIIAALGTCFSTCVVEAHQSRTLRRTTRGLLAALRMRWSF